MRHPLVGYTTLSICIIAGCSDPASDRPDNLVFAGESLVDASHIHYVREDNSGQDETYDQDRPTEPVMLDPNWEACRMVYNGGSLAIIKITSDATHIPWYGCDSPYSTITTFFDADVLAVAAGKELPRKLTFGNSLYIGGIYSSGKRGKTFLISIREHGGQYFGLSAEEVDLNREDIVEQRFARSLPGNFEELSRLTSNVHRNAAELCHQWRRQSEEEFHSAVFESNEPICQEGYERPEEPVDEAELCASDNPPECCTNDLVECP